MFGASPCPFWYCNLLVDDSLVNVFVCLFAPDLFSYYWQFEQSGSLWHLTIGEDILIPRGSQTSKILHKIARNRENFEDMGQNCNFISWNAPSRIYLLPPLYSPPPFCSDLIIILYKQYARSGIMLSISDDILMRYLEARALKKSWDKHCNVINFIPIWLYSTFKEWFCFFFFF